MADYDARFNRLALSAADLKQITAQQKPGEPWPDALIEDYLNILRDLIELADLIEENAASIITDIQALKQNFAGNDARISKAYGQIDFLSRIVRKDRSQSSEYDGKQKSLVSTLRRDCKSYFPAKACFLALSGEGLLDPTVTINYNVQVVSRTGVGTYLVTLQNGTLDGIDIPSRCIYSYTAKIAGTPASDLYQVEFTPGVGQFTFVVYQYTIVGAKITKVAYDLQLLDLLSITLLVHQGNLYQAL